LKPDYKEFTIVIPTLNEKLTIREVIRYVTRNYPGVSVLVMDDGSTDGTKSTVRELSKIDRRVRLIDRKALGASKGLTASVVDGIVRSGTKYVIVMDADMQHSPGKIEDIAKELTNGNDLAVANRAKITDWAPYRKIISRVFMYCGKIILFIRAKETCVDIFSGFFGIRRDLFVSVYEKNKHRFVGEGYKVLFDFLKCVDRGTLKIKNVPFVFRIREFGKSKAGYKQGMALVKSFLS
jgi:dolichol-phosphate mannosyltransferase